MEETGFIMYHALDYNWAMDKAHFHDRFEILLPLSGQTQFFINKDIYCLKPKSLVLIAAGSLHHSFSENQLAYERYVLQFGPAILKKFSSEQTDLLNLFNKTNLVMQLSEANYLHIKHLFNLCYNLKQEGFGADLKRQMAFLTIILYISGLIDRKDCIQPDLNSNFGKISPVIAYLDSNLGEDINLDFLANKFYINKFYLCHLFKEASGFTILEYLNNRRIIYASRLLRQGYSVQKAAEEAGFSGASSFIRVFKKVTGLSPGQYAKRYKNSQLIE